jgi:hypothetical protein
MVTQEEYMPPSWVEGGSHHSAFRGEVTQRATLWAMEHPTTARYLNEYGEMCVVCQDKEGQCWRYIEHANGWHSAWATQVVPLGMEALA